MDNNTNESLIQCLEDIELGIHLYYYPSNILSYIF